MLTRVLYAFFGSLQHKAWICSWILDTFQYGMKATVSHAVETPLLNEKGIFIFNAHNLSYPVTFYQELSHSETSPVQILKCLVEHEQIRLKLRTSKLHGAVWPLLASPVKDYQGRKAESTNQFFVISSWVLPVASHTFQKVSVLRCFWKY